MDDPRLERLLPVLKQAARVNPNPRSQRTRLLLLVTVGLLATAAIAVGAVVIGQPAPKDVKDSFAAADRLFMKAGLNTDSAQAVAVDGDTVLYAAESAGGGYCAILRGPGVTGRLNCRSGVSSVALTIYESTLTQPNEPIVLDGRLSNRGSSLAGILSNGQSVSIPVGTNGFFVYRPNAQQEAAVRTGGITLIERDKAGNQTDRRAIAPPLQVSTVGIPPHRIVGHVRLHGARYVAVTVLVLNGKVAAQNGSDGLVEVDPKGRFTWTAPVSAGDDYLVSISILDRRFQHLTNDIPIGSVEPFGGTP